MNDTPDNLSDHLAISMTMNLAIRNLKNNEVNEQNKIPVYPKALWQDLKFETKYKDIVINVLDKISVIPTDELSYNDAEKYVNDLYDGLCTGMHYAVRLSNSTSTNNRDSSGRRTKKWWWNKDCLVLRKRNRLFHHIWKSCGKPISGSVADCYKASRKANRKC